MKNIQNRIKILLVVSAISISFTSCNYNEIVDAEYPNQMIYMPAAAYGVNNIDAYNPETGTYRYRLDLENNRLIIPLSVYRSGINNKGVIEVAILINKDTINQIIDSEQIDSIGIKLQLLPSTAFTIESSVTLNDGEESKRFALSIDLDYIRTQPNKRLAIGIDVKSDQVATSTKLKTTIVEIGTNFLIPTPNFTYSVSKSDDKTFTFVNTSTFALKYSWDFGDGTPVVVIDQSEVAENDTLVHTFPSIATYTVKLTATGITGVPVTYEYPLHIWENISTMFLKNPGDPFLRSDSRTNRTGNLLDWITTDNLKSLSSGVLYGGFYNDSKKGPVMDFFSPKSITNGKIYQITHLPKGNYRVEFTPVEFIGKNDCYFIVASGTMLPNIENIQGNSSVLISSFWNSDIGNTVKSFDLIIANDQDVTIGFVISTPVPLAGVFNEVKIKSVGLYR